MAACQTCNAPDSPDSSVLAVFDLRASREIAAWVPESGWASAYSFPAGNASICLLYRDGEAFDFGLDGHFIDREQWISAQWCTPARREGLDQALANYLILTAGETGLRFWTTARVLRPKLERLVSEGNPNPVFRYALLAIWDAGELRPELVPDPVAEAEALRRRNPAPLAVLAVIEAIEQLFLFEKREGDDVAADRLRGRLVAFDTLAELPCLSDLEVAQIQHHKGKALKRLGETEAAALLFEEVLAGPVPISETRLQLIDVLRAPLALLALAAAPADQGRIRYVTDGDTFRLESGERIRIAGIDTPEIHAGRAKCRAAIELREAAAARVRTLLDHRDVTFVRVPAVV